MKRIFFLLLIVTVFGCNRDPRPEGFPSLYPCTIDVVQDGEPLLGYTVSLMPPDPETNKWSSGGTADPSGTVRPRTHGRFDGVPEGVYKVTVSKQESEGEQIDVPMTATAEEMKRIRQRGKENPYRLFDVVNSRYRSHQTTPLEIRVEPKSANRFTLDVGKSVREPVKMP